MRRRLVVLIVAALLGLGAPGQSNAAENEVAAASAENQGAENQGAENQGVAASGEGTTAASDEPTATPAEAAPPATAGPPTGGPEQETSSESDADVSNDAAVDQSSGQAQDGGDTGDPTTAGDGPAQSGQEAHTAQQVQADAAASSSDAHNDAASVRAGEGNAGDGAAVEQSSGAAADATATATQATGQQGAGTAASAGEQSATASANARASDSANTLLDARFGAPGDDAAFGQSVRAGAAARAELEGPGNAQQQSRADATAEVANARNTAVELRIGSDGDSAGGRQSIVADADATAAAASASAVLENPFNTFVSLRVNSNGTTGPVQQEISRRESETVNGSVTERLSEDASDRTWQFDADGIGIDFASDGANTDLRISVDQSTLADPGQAPLFVWQWDMVFGPGSQPDCEITSSAAADRVTWSFDCDPDDQIERPEAAASTAIAPPAGALSWIWSWLRPQLPEWSWEQNDVILLPACGPTCTMLLDFRWISFEPIEASVAPTAETAVEDTAVEAAVQQVNEVTASATASAESTIEQTLLQSGGNQAALQQAAVSQLVTAHAAAELTYVDNVSAGIAAHVAQANRATALVTAAAGAEIVQLLSQQQTGENTTQAQVALQSASTTQELTAGAIATVKAASNSDLSVGGSATQSAIGSATVTGVELASTRQVAEQEQQGDESDQEQLAGQWADTAQQLELLAAAGVAGARISSTLNGDSATLEIGAEAVSTGTSKSAIHQLTLQLQAGDEVAQQQESYQIASVEQSGTALAAATAGGTLRYVLVPAAVVGPAGSPAEAQEGPLAQAAIAAPIESSFVPVTAVLAVSTNPRAQSPSRRPALTPLRPTVVRQQAAARAAPLAILVIKDSASKAGVAGPAPKRAKDAEKAPVRSPRDLCLAPCIGASAAASAGTGSGGALVALLPGASLLSVPSLGRWLSTPAGRRSAAFVLLQAKPG